MIDNNTSGLHFAFAAGTGALVYVDLVAKLLLQSVGAFPPENCMNPGFKFVLFASFDSRQGAIALELLEGFRDLQKSMGLNSFDLELRFSDQKTKRWDKDFIIERLKHHLDLYTKSGQADGINVSNISKSYDNSRSASAFREDEKRITSDSKIKRIWVCGPPVMEETYDKFMPEVAEKFNLDYRTVVDIM